MGRGLQALTLIHKKHELTPHLLVEHGFASVADLVGQGHSPFADVPTDPSKTATVFRASAPGHGLNCCSSLSFIFFRNPYIPHDARGVRLS
jgi:hypothetical protein